MQHIQTARYTYCQSCCNLHPGHEFELPGLQKASPDKHCKWPGLTICRRTKLAGQDSPIETKQDLPVLTGGSSGLYLCSILPNRAINNRKVLIEVDYIFSFIRHEFQPTQPESIRVCPHICLLDLVDPDSTPSESTKVLPLACKKTQCLHQGWLRTSRKF